MAAVFSFFVILGISLLILKISGEVLRLTGLSKDVATFQAQSAFTGTGFTTKESEIIVSHPVRRRVITVLMFVRNVGFITVSSSLILSFISTSGTEDVLIRSAYMGGGILLLFIISKIKLLSKLLSFLISLALKKWTKIHVHDYENLLNLAGEFEVSEFKVQEESWLANKTLLELRLPDEGLLILGIKRPDGYFIGTPRSVTTIYPEDWVVLYGSETGLRNISRRIRSEEGDNLHAEAVKQHTLRQGKPIIKAKKTGLLKRFFGKKKKD